MNFESLLKDVKQSHSLIDDYDQTYGKIPENETLKHNVQYITNLYYNLVTDFYEYGWGGSFHFATRYKGETFMESIKRHEQFLSGKLQLKKGMKVLDMGSGVGGPARTIASFSGAEITAVTINDYQVDRCKYLTPADLQKLVTCHQGDFTNLKNYKDESFDSVYAIESIVHVEPKTSPFAQAYRVLKKGGLFASYEWVMTPKYDQTNKTHVQIKRGVEHGDALPDLISIESTIQQLKEVGFEVLEHFDVDLFSQQVHGSEYVPWYLPLQPGWSLDGFKSTMPGRYLTQAMLTVFETIKLAPEGSLKVAKMLEDAAFNLERGGSLGIFTPMYLVIARKN